MSALHDLTALGTALIVVVATTAHAQPPGPPPTGAATVAPAPTAPAAPFNPALTQVAPRADTTFTAVDRAAERPPGTGATEPATGAGVPPLQTFVGKLTGRPGGKDDGAQPLAFPEPPARSGDVNLWLVSHKDGLLGVLRKLYPVRADIQAFDAAESSTCSGNIYCEITYREQAISYALGISR